MFKFNPHFEIYLIMVAFGDEVKTPFFNWWYFTKRAAETNAQILTKRYGRSGMSRHFYVERVICCRGEK